MENKLSIYQTARWLALYEAVNIIADKAEEKGIDFNKLSIKEPAIEAYIEKTSDIICRCLNEEQNRKVNHNANKIQ